MAKKYLVNVSDMSRVNDDFFFHLLVDGKLTSIKHDLYKNQIDGVYIEFKYIISEEQQKATCEILSNKFKIRYRTKKR